MKIYSLLYYLRIFPSKCGMGRGVAICVAMAMMVGLWGTPLMAQHYTSSNSKAVKLFEKGQEALYQSRSSDAIKYFEQAAQLDPSFAEPNIMMAEWYLDVGNRSLAKQYYYAAVKAQPDFYAQAWLWLGQLELEEDRYAEAKTNFEVFLSKDKKNVPARERAQYGVACAEFRSYAYAHPVDFHPENLGSLVNTPYDEYLPSLTADGKNLVFTRRGPKKPSSTSNTPEEEDLYQYTFGEEKPARRLAEPLNSSDNEGAQCISRDGHIMIFTACERPDGAGRCDLYQSIWADGKWTKPRNLGAGVNTAAWESQPCLSLDGHTLFFASDRKGGQGGIDIWMARLVDGRWGSPVNLGPTINTAGDETSPFIHFDGKTLYFASTGHVGMGGADLFVSRLQADGSWSEPVNLGYPINTAGHETGLAVSPDGSTAYFASDQPGGIGRNDLYAFALPVELQPEPVVYVDEIAETSKLEVGESVTLQNVFFSTGKYTLVESSLAELDKVVQLLQSNPTLKIELGGHTDNVGNDGDNLKLSEQRAKTVYEYLVSRGIAPQRLSYKGYGETQPVAPNDTEEGRAANRRTVFTIIEK